MLNKDKPLPKKMNKLQELMHKLKTKYDTHVRVQHEASDGG